MFYLAEAAASRSATLAAARAIAAADQGHAAVYYPRLVLPDPANPGATISVGPSAAVAGLLARTDINRGVWGFAAGTTAYLQGAVGLGTAIDAHGAALLRRAGVNALRSVPGPSGSTGVARLGVAAISRSPGASSV